MMDRDYHLAITNEERLAMERGSYDFYREHGVYMKLPPKLYSDLKRAGVNMKYMIADQALEN